MAEQDPVALARALESTSTEVAAETLKVLPLKLAAQMVMLMTDSFSVQVMVCLPEPFFAALAARLPPEKNAQLFRSLPSDVRPRLLACLDEKNRRAIADQMAYPEDSVGRMMSGDFLAFRLDAKVKETIPKIRQLAARGFPASYVYLVDSENRLAGVMNMRDLLLAGTDDTLGTVMRKDVFSVKAFMPFEEAARAVGAKPYFAVPVVDGDGRLRGVIRSGEILGGIRALAGADIQKMFGAGSDERPFSPVRFSFRKRLPWLFVNLLTAFMAAAVVSLFESVIAKATVLAVFLPVIAGQGGNAGAQSLAVVMRGLVMREIPAEQVGRLIWKESWIGMLNGVVIGAVTALGALLWLGNPFLGAVVGLGMFVNLLIAGFSGAAIPLLMKALRLDPAQCSNIILTTVTDVMGFLVFLGFACVWLERLV